MCFESSANRDADNRLVLAKDKSGPMELNISCRKTPRLGRPTRRTAEVATRFGIPLQASTVTILESLAIPIRPRTIVLILGPSGSGKSSALAEIERQFPTGHAVHRVDFRPDASIIDEVAPKSSFTEAANLLTACGLGESRLWLRTFDSLSEGERFRARLARTIAVQQAETPHVTPHDSTQPNRHSEIDNRQLPPLLCDEFCSSLHRRAALAISHNLRKLVTHRNLCMILASNNDDIVSDLQPDIIVRLQQQGLAIIEPQRVAANRSLSLRKKLVITPGRKADYDAFASMHYRATDELGFVDRIFTLRERDGDTLGIVVYSHSPLELSLRNQATNGWFTRSARRVNKHLRILRRLVIHPDIRGCGLGHYLVRQTMPLLGTQYVECLAAMGEHNPVFERAGMTRVGQYDISPQRKAALDTLRKMDVDPNHRDFVQEVCRKPTVRRLVAQVVHDWYAATTAGGESRVERQSPEFLAQTFHNLITTRPVYYLWKRPNLSRKNVKSDLIRAKKVRHKMKMNPTKMRATKTNSRQSTSASTRRKRDRHNPFK